MRARAFLLIAALPFAACGDDDTGTPPTTTAPTAETSSPTTSAPAGVGDEIAIQGFLFRPDAVEIEAGTTVTWTNGDSFAHTVTADDDTFASGDIAGDGGTFDQTFDEPGTYSYFCNIHNYMKGAITVV